MEGFEMSLPPPKRVNQPPSAAISNVNLLHPVQPEHSLKPSASLLKPLTHPNSPTFLMSAPPVTWLLMYLLILFPFLPTMFASIPAIPMNFTCHNTCGAIPVKYPFGTSFGCGHPDFARNVRCSSTGKLEFSTASGIYDVASMDYSTRTMIITDPLMSTCESMQNSGSFSLDRASPFSVMDNNIFVLLGCSTNSPVYDPYEELCDTGSNSRVCRGLYSCKGVTGIGLQQNAPVSTCCVYQSPTGFGSSYALDLPKLQCSSYSAIYGFGDDRGDPSKWRFGISVQFNDSYYTDACTDCEASGGFCGFSGVGESFACLCHNGMNTTNNCFGRGYAWSGTWGPKSQARIIISGLMLWWVVLSISLPLI